MARVSQRVLLLLAVTLTTGCAGPLDLMAERAKGGAGVPVGHFWPPAGATAVVLAEPAVAGATVTLGEAAARAASVLDDAGYAAKRWYPIGARCAHGFAVTTLLERVGPAGARAATAERWSALFPEPVNLAWLAEARQPRLPGAGHYRAYLIAFSDLHTRRSGQAPRLEGETLMEAVDGSSTEFPSDRIVPATYRFGAYIYEYGARGDDGDGAFLAVDDDVSAYQHLERSGLASLVATTER
jgi:hypothetical protein